MNVHVHTTYVIYNYYLTCLISVTNRSIKEHHNIQRNGTTGFYHNLLKPLILSIQCLHIKFC